MCFLYPKELYCCFDIDMVCIKDAREMLKFEHFSAMQRPGAPGFCSGLMVFRPDKKVFESIVNNIIPQREKWRLIDQSVLNAYYTDEHPEEVIVLPWKWNTSKREIRQRHWKQLLDEAIFLHYHGPHKPWIEDADGYAEAHAVWHEA